MAALISPADLPESLSGRSDISRLIIAASSLAEQFCRRTFSREIGRVETHDGGDWAEIWLRLTPVETVTLVTHNGSTVSEFVFNPETGRLRRGDGYGDIDFSEWFPAGADNISVTYTGGYAKIPEEIKEAVVIGVTNLVREKNRDIGLQSENIGGEYSWTAKTDTTDRYWIFGNTGKSLLRGFRRSGKYVIG
jgi:hypothetical protein